MISEFRANNLPAGQQVFEQTVNTKYQLCQCISACYGQIDNVTLNEFDDTSEAACTAFAAIILVPTSGSFGAEIKSIDLI